VGQCGCASTPVIETVSKKKYYLTEVVPAGPKAAKEAAWVRTRRLNEVDEKRSPCTRETVNQLMDGTMRCWDSSMPGFRRAGHTAVAGSSSSIASGACMS
jgi:hypothetical protein